MTMIQWLVVMVTQRFGNVMKSDICDPIIYYSIETVIVLCGIIVMAIDDDRYDIVYDLIVIVLMTVCPLLRPLAWLFYQFGIRRLQYSDDLDVPWYCWLLLTVLRDCYDPVIVNDYWLNWASEGRVVIYCYYLQIHSSDVLLFVIPSIVWRVLFWRIVVDKWLIITIVILKAGLPFWLDYGIDIIVVDDITWLIGIVTVFDCY